MNQERKIRVAVVFGGRGPEHAISCASGGTVLACIDRDRYDVVPIGILPDGRWVLTADEPERLAITGGQLPSVEAVAEPGAQVLPWTAGGSRGEPGALGSGALATHAPATGAPANDARATDALATAEPGAIPAELGEVDVVLPMLHGPFGEDGTMQGLLEMAGVRYVGAGVLASAVSMDKEYMKLVFAARDLPICPYVVVRDRDWQGGPGVSATAERKRIYDAIAELGYPVFVKPARGGSSIGTSKAADQAALIEAIEGARRYDSKVIVERAVDGAEIECAVLEGLDGGPPDTSLPGQLVIEGGEEFYDFEAKYLDPSGSMAIYTRDGTVLANEINTIPGMTATSYFPKMWEATGLPLPQLLDRMIATALRRRHGAP